MTTSIINTRAHYDLTWSTAPRHVGYPGQGEKDDFNDLTPDFRGTPRQIVAEIERVRRVTGDCYIAMRVTGHGLNLSGNDFCREIEMRLQGL